MTQSTPNGISNSENKLEDVFICYHRSDESRARAKYLVERLKSRFSVRFDEFVKHSAGPPEGWGVWSRDGVFLVKAVLMLCDPSSHHIFNTRPGIPPGSTGRGFEAESFQMLQYLTAFPGNNLAIRAVCFDKAHGEASIPIDLINYGPFHLYDEREDDEFDRLCTWITDRQGSVEGRGNGEAAQSSNDQLETIVSQDFNFVGSDEEFKAALIPRLKKSFAEGDFQQILEEVCSAAGCDSSNTPEDLLRFICNSDQPIRLLQTYVSVCSAHPEFFDRWKSLLDIFISLLSLCVNPAWITEHLKLSKNDQLQFRIDALCSRVSGYQDVVLARLDSDWIGHGTWNLELSDFNAPDTYDQVERIGLFLYAQLLCDSDLPRDSSSTPPERMSDQHWEDLNSKLVWRRYSPRRSFVLSIGPAEMADESLLTELYRRLSNLPRFLLADNSAAADNIRFFVDDVKVANAVQLFMSLKLQSVCAADKSEA